MCSDKTTTKTTTATTIDEDNFMLIIWLMYVQLMYDNSFRTSPKEWCQNIADKRIFCCFFFFTFKDKNDFIV